MQKKKTDKNMQKFEIKASNFVCFGCIMFFGSGNDINDIDI